MMADSITPDIWLKGGLLDRKHRERMGEAIWLYLHLLQLVRFSGDGAGVTPEEFPYKHPAAAERLGLSLRTVKYHLDTLVEGGYVRVVRRLAHGLILAIEKYPDARKRAAERRHREVQPAALQPPPDVQPEVQETAPRDVQPAALPDAPEVQDAALREVQSGVERSAIQRQVKCNPASSEVQAVAPLTNEDKSPRVQESQGGVRARALTPEQLVVNEWMVVLERDPYKASDYSRWMPAAVEIVAAGHAPHDVRNCTKYLLTDDWRREKRKPPTLAEVRDALPTWIEDGRPGTVAAMKRMRERKPDRAARFAASLAAIPSTQPDQRKVLPHGD